MTRTDIYKLFHRFTAEEKNASLARLLKNKHILKDEKINIKNGKIDSIFTISEYGENLIESKVYN
jgi:hypothetical protein